ncbi:MAG TPA: hypothetical protein VM511_06575 [Luteolibacter sp.]|nr:hypothetical protein [Luteolibacter sp.]
MTGKSGRGSGLYHFLRLTARAMVFLLVLSAVAMVYLIKRVDTESFREKFEGRIVNGIEAREGKMEGFQRVQGKLSISRFAATGKESAFFTDVDLRDIGCRMGTFDGLMSTWKPGVITAARMDMNLRAGTRGADEAARLGDVLFKTRPGVEITGFDVEEATVGWGYSEFNRGLIRDSEMRARKRESDWWFQFKGGTFSQNWLKGLQIEHIEIVCDGNGLRFEKGILRKGNGTLDLAGLTVKGKEQPEVSGVIRMKNLSLEGMLPVSAESLLEGFISGELKVSGSTNLQEGISFDGRIVMGEGDGLMIRDRVPLLKTLRTVDVFNNYRRVNFHTGSFRMKTGGGRMSISDVDLAAGDLMTLGGNLVVRHPSKEEKILAGDSAELPVVVPDKDETAQEVDFTLRRAGKESRKNENKDAGVMGRYEVRQDDRRFAQETAAKLAESLRYEGEFEISLRADAFDQSPALKATYPKNEATGRIPMKVPIEGTLSVLTLKQAEEISTQGKR